MTALREHAMSHRNAGSSLIRSWYDVAHASILVALFAIVAAVYGNSSRDVYDASSDPLDAVFHVDRSICNIERRTHMTAREFLDDYYYTRPVILVHAHANSSKCFTRVITISVIRRIHAHRTYQRALSHSSHHFPSHSRVHRMRMCVRVLCVGGGVEQRCVSTDGGARHAATGIW